MLEALINPDQELRCVLSLSLFLGQANSGFAHFQVFLPDAVREHTDAASMHRQKLMNSFKTYSKIFQIVIALCRLSYTELALLQLEQGSDGQLLPGNPYNPLFGCSITPWHHQADDQANIGSGLLLSARQPSLQWWVQAAARPAARFISALHTSALHKSLVLHAMQNSRSNIRT